MRPCIKRHAASAFYILFILCTMVLPTWAALSPEKAEDPPLASRTAHLPLSPQIYHRATPINPIDMSYGNPQHFTQATTDNIASYVLPFIQTLRCRDFADGVIASYLILAQQYIQKTYFDHQSQRHYRPTLNVAMQLTHKLDQTIQHYDPRVQIPTIARLFHLVVDELFPTSPTFHQPAFIAFQAGFEATKHSEKVATLALRTAVSMLGPELDIDLFINIHSNLVILAMRGVDNLSALENHFQAINSMLSGLAPWQLPPVLQALNHQSFFTTWQQQLEQQTASTVIGEFSPIEPDTEDLT